MLKLGDFIKIQATKLKPKIEGYLKERTDASVNLLKQKNPFNPPSVKAPELSSMPQRTDLLREAIFGKKQPYIHHIPTGNPHQPEVPQELAQIFMEELDKDKVATDSARMMSHSSQNTRTPAEIKRMGGLNVNIGENPYFNPKAKNKNSDGTTDFGLGMLNEKTVDELLSKPFWKNRMAKRGIPVDRLDEKALTDPRTNLKLLLTRLEYGNWDSKQKKMKEKPNYFPWYAAPLDLRTR